jgi:hypothetical protein
MPRRELLTAAQRKALLAFPEEEENLLQYYTLSVRDLATVRQHRGDHNQLGFAVLVFPTSVFRAHSQARGSSEVVGKAARGSGVAWCVRLQ